jgi:hypothetical protein
MSQLNGRLSKLEQKATPAKKIVVLYGDELAPDDLPEGTVIIRVIYGDGGGRNDEP